MMLGDLKMRKASACFIAFGTIIAIPYSVSAEEGSFGEGPGMEELGKMTIGPGSSREERGANIHDQMYDDKLNAIQKNQGDGPMLQEEQYYRRTHQW
jgi:hypothetical protein